MNDDNTSKIIENTQYIITLEDTLTISDINFEGGLQSKFRDIAKAAINQFVIENFPKKEYIMVHSKIMEIKININQIEKLPIIKQLKSILLAHENPLNAEQQDIIRESIARKLRTKLIAALPKPLSTQHVQKVIHEKAQQDALKAESVKQLFLANDQLEEAMLSISYVLNNNKLLLHDPNSGLQDKTTAKLLNMALYDIRRSLSILKNFEHSSLCSLNKTERNNIERWLENDNNQTVTLEHKNEYDNAPLSQLQQTNSNALDMQPIMQPITAQDMLAPSPFSSSLSYHRSAPPNTIGPIQEQPNENEEEHTESSLQNTPQIFNNK